MCNQEEPLTEKQRDLIEKNHNLIYGFADIYNVDIEEYYDVLAIGLCKAAKAFDKTKGEFSTIAYTCMRNEWVTQRKVDSKAPYNIGISYEDIRNIDELQCAYDTSGAEDKYNSIDAAMMEKFISSLSQEERVVLCDLINGSSQAYIAATTDSTKYKVDIHVKEIRKKAEYFLF